MNVSSNYNDYYRKINYQKNLSSTSNDMQNIFKMVDNDTSGFDAKSKESSSLGNNFVGFTFNGNMMKNMLQMQGVNSAEMAQNMATMKADMKSLKSADLDSMPKDDMKQLLTKLETDRNNMPKPENAPENPKKVDLEQMSESDMRNMLKDMKKHAEHGPKMPPTIMDSSIDGTSNNFGVNSLINAFSNTDNDSDSSASSLFGENNYLQQIVNNLTSNSASSTSTDSGYASSLKEILKAYFSKQQFSKA